MEWLRACPESQCLIRCRKTSIVTFEDKSYKIQELATLLNTAHQGRELRFRGKTAYQHIADHPITSSLPLSQENRYAGVKQLYHGSHSGL